MKYRRFGRTELEISEIAFGGGRSGGILIDADDVTRRKAVRAALDHGINWFDTAPQYGQDKSEEALGWLLEEVPETPFVSTKIMITEADHGDIAGAVQRGRQVPPEGPCRVNRVSPIKTSATPRPIGAAFSLRRP